MADQPIRGWVDPQYVIRDSPGARATMGLQTFAGHVRVREDKATPTDAQRVAEWFRGEREHGFAAVSDMDRSLAESVLAAVFGAAGHSTGGEA